MKRFRFSVVLMVLALLLILWIDLPRSIPIKFQFASYKIDTAINPLSIDVTIFGKKIKKDFKTKLGLDLQGGSHLVFDTKMDGINPDDRNDALESVRNVIEKRVNLFGVSEPNIKTLKTGNQHRIVVDLPGINDVNEAVALIGQTAVLSFKEIENSESTDSAVVLKDTPLTGKYVKKATVQFDQNSGKPAVGLQFDSKGGKLFEEITSRNIGKPVLILLDNRILTQPVVQQAISGGEAVITGDFSVDEARQLSVAINSGALPVPIQLVEQRTIGATLGATEVKKSVVAGILGLSAVIGFMILYYRRLGVLAAIALLIYGAITLAIFKIIPVTLTLPGIAGFILSIGMAVDSNILIFERIREELRKGKEWNIAIRLGFGRAIDAIKDANITTLLVAFILFNPLNWDFFPQLGLIRGFALTLAIGVATSLFTGVVITKRLIETFYKKP
ncbi:MAG TPA: protein translocase subunit SecD [Candidatus Nitrosocosmicus sp.]|nr:protein translocase subunit SecD [Candidatus Nitrosocosmicus sp.]